MSKDHLILIDASAFAFRAYYSWPAWNRPSDGAPVGAVLGFMSMIWRTLGAAQADQPTMGAAIFDAPGRNFRHRIYPQYKANRPLARRIEIDAQLPLMRHAAETLGLLPLEKKGFEADDVIATLADRAHKAGIRVTIVSSDKDFGQMVVDDHIEIVDPMQKTRKRAADVQAKFGVPPHLVAHVQALAGDEVDGIPGIGGCGIERASAMIRRFGSLEEVLANAKSVTWPSVRSRLQRDAKIARMCLKLATLRRDVPMVVDFETLRVRPIMRAHLFEITKALEATARFEAIFGLDPKNARDVKRVADPLDWWREELIAPGQSIPDDPQSGFYKTKNVHKGPWVPARIWRETEAGKDGADTGRDMVFCEVDGRPRDPSAMWVRLSMYPISEADFNFMRADSAHAKAYRPDDPKADPHQPINLIAAKAPKNPRSAA